ncbi:MAG: flagellar basal body rod protein FlgB [Deltaproteobacteria bacterium]|nr:flagellar basal body rod protein FlgB [Deltaproteobacteria bacterium]
MRFERLLQNRFMSRTATILSRALDFRSANQKIIAGNLANIDTPGYKTREFNFENVLQKASDKTQIHLKTTNHRHITDVTLPHVQDVEIKQSGSLNLDTEMAKMMRNNLLYETSTKLLSKKFQSLREAIESGRR